MSKKDLMLFLGLLCVSIGAFFSVVFTFLTPFPIAFAFKKRNRYYAISILLIAFALIYFIQDIVNAGLYLAVAGTIGLAIGFQIEKISSVDIKKVIFNSIAVSLLVFAILFFSVFVIQEVYSLSIFKLIDLHIHSIAEKTLPKDTSFVGLNGTVYKGITEVALYLKHNLLFLGIMSLVVLLVLNIYFLAGFFPDCIDRTKLYTWKVDSAYIWVVLSLAFLVLVTKGTLGIVSENLLRVSLIAYFFQGIAIVAYYLRRIKLPIVIKTFIVVVCGVYLTIPSTFVGFVDHWLELRKPKKLQGA